MMIDISDETSEIDLRETCNQGLKMKILILCILLLTPIMGHTENYIIYSISHEIPMTNDFQEMKKKLLYQYGYFTRSRERHRLKSCSYNF